MLLNAKETMVVNLGQQTSCFPYRAKLVLDFSGVFML